jgi:DNA primase
VKLMDLVRPIFDAIPDTRLKSLYAQELSHRMSVGLDWVRMSLNSTPSQRDYPKATTAVMPEEVQKTLAPEARKPLFLISGASQAETLLLQFSLKSRANFELVLSQQILSQISHLGVKNLFEKAEQVYRQDIAKFDRLTSLLIDYVDHPELLFSNSQIGAGEFDAEKENKMIMDCCKRIQQTFLKARVKSISLGINKNDTEKLKEIEDLQRNRISLNNKSDKNDKN